MDKTTKALRARLREILFQWLQSDAILYFEMKEEAEADALQAHEASGLKIPESALDRRIVALAGTDHNGLARVFLTRLADDDEIGLLVSQIGERRPLKRILTSLIGEEPSEQWVVSRPGLSTPSLPQDIRNMTTLIELMALAIIPEWLDHLDKGAPDIDGLTPDTRAFLKAMLALNLHDGTRAGQEEIWAKVAELGNAIEGKSKREAAVGILKDRKLIESKPKSGTTLTELGLKAAASLSSRNNSH